jgi:hypothetical protein
MSAMSSHLYENPPDPWQMIDTPFGRMEAWRASTLMTGRMGATHDFMQQAMQQFEQLRNDSVTLKDELTTWASELTAREEALNERTQAVVDFAGRTAEFYERTETLYNQLKAEAEEEPIEAPPGTSQEPEPVVDTEAHGPEPTGDLHDIPPKEGPTTEDNEGDVPAELELEEGSSELTEPPEPSGTAYPQPTAISLNSK